MAAQVLNVRRVSEYVIPNLQKLPLPEEPIIVLANPSLPCVNTGTSIPENTLLCILAFLQSGLDQNLILEVVNL